MYIGKELPEAIVFEPVDETSAPVEPEPAVETTSVEVPAAEPVSV